MTRTDACSSTETVRNAPQNRLPKYFPVLHSLPKPYPDWNFQISFRSYHVEVLLTPFFISAKLFRYVLNFLRGQCTNAVETEDRHLLNAILSEAEFFQVRSDFAVLCTLPNLPVVCLEMISVENIGRRHTSPKQCQDCLRQIVILLTVVGYVPLYAFLRCFAGVTTNRAHPEAACRPREAGPGWSKK